MLRVEQFLGVDSGNFQAVRFADGSLVEPAGRFGHILERVVHRVQDTVGARLPAARRSPMKCCQCDGRRCAAKTTPTCVFAACLLGLLLVH
jgi:hypothetical protein